MKNVSIFRAVAISALTTWTAVVSGAVLPRSGELALQTVYQFGNFTWLENFAVRSNGHIITTDIDKGLIYDVDPRSSPVTALVVATLPQGSIPAGIAEVEPDVFYFNNGLGTAVKFAFTANSSAIWKIDMNPYAKTGKAITSKVIDMPQAVFLNGMVTESMGTGVIFVSDSSAGKIYSVNVRKPSYSVALDHPILKPNATIRPNVGVNGLRIRSSKLYFTNTNYGYLGTFPLSASGAIVPNPTLITSSVPTADDFDIDRSGNIWVAQNQLNTLVRVTPAGQVTLIAGGRNSTALVGPVSARFGRDKERDTLFVSTDDLTFDTSRNPLTTAGKIAKINTATSGSGSWRI